MSQTIEELKQALQTLQRQHYKQQEYQK